MAIASLASRAKASKPSCMAEELQPNLIVMDVGLRGEVDGIQAARMILERFHIPVIFMTGHRDVETLQRAVRTGPLGYILKPFQEVELRSAIRLPFISTAPTSPTENVRKPCGETPSF